jgi:DNA-binding transcriptional ArsR family regulator
MTDRAVTTESEPLWPALADPTRRAILDALRAGPRTTGALVESLSVSRFAVMRHLNVLCDARLVTVERRGRERLNHLNPVPLQQTHERWVRPFAASSATALLRLGERAHAEGRSMSSIPYGLDVRAQHDVAADRESTWTALLDLAAWWPACWEDDERLLFEPQLGGRLGTVRGDGFDDPAGGTLWGVVVGLRPQHELVLDGTMGLPGPVAGEWRMHLDGAGTDTVVTVHHRVLGEVEDEHRAAFTSRWDGVLAALARHAPGAIR